MWSRAGITNWEARGVGWGYLLLLPRQRGAGKLRLLRLLLQGLHDLVPCRLEGLTVLGGYGGLVKVSGKRRRRVLWVVVRLLLLDMVAGGGILG